MDRTPHGLGTASVAVRDELDELDELDVEDNRMEWRGQWEGIVVQGVRVWYNEHLFAGIRVSGVRMVN